MEALTNAMEHGNGWDQDKPVAVRRSEFTRGEMRVTISDQGPGFAWRGLPDPTINGNILAERWPRRFFDARHNGPGKLQRRGEIR